MKKIAITGGPCAGKTKSLNLLQQVYRAQGYTVLTIPEAATTLLNSGISAPVFGAREFQRAVLRMQLASEQIFENISRNTENALIFCDRGVWDGAAYIAADEFVQLVRGEGLSPNTLNARYDAVLCLSSVAKSPSGNYSNENNTARFENREEAVQVDNRIISVWQTHPEFYLIPVRDTFEEKLQHMIDTIDLILKKT